MASPSRWPGQAPTAPATSTARRRRTGPPPPPGRSAPIWARLTPTTRRRRPPCAGQQWLAYRGTDGHVNLLSGPQAANYVVTDYTTLSPAVTCFNGQIFLSFVPANNTNHIQVEYGAPPTASSCPSSSCTYSSTQYALTNSSGAQDTTFDPPALAADPANIYLAFTGADSQGKVNIAQSPLGASAAWTSIVLDN